MRKKELLLCTDLDGTVLGDEEGEALFRAWVARHRERLALAYVTGRSHHNVCAFIKEEKLPEADFLCSDCGAAAWDLRDPENKLGRYYDAMVDPQWPAEAIRIAGESVETPLQGPEGQGTHKASFFWDGKPETLDAFRKRLRPFQDCHISAVGGMYLDALPMCFNKGQGVRFFAAASGLEIKRTVVCGDAEHDLDMYLTGARGIVPANAVASLKEALKDKGVFFASLPRAKGMLEGLKQMGWE